MPHLIKTDTLEAVSAEEMKALKERGRQHFIKAKTQEFIGRATRTARQKNTIAKVLSVSKR